MKGWEKLGMREGEYLDRVKSLDRILGAPKESFRMELVFFSQPGTKKSDFR